MSTSNAGQSAGQLETRGIEPVPEAECNGHPLQLFSYHVWSMRKVAFRLPRRRLKLRDYSRSLEWAWMF